MPEQQISPLTRASPPLTRELIGPWILSSCSDQRMALPSFNTNLLVFTDWVSKLVVIVPMKKTSASQVATAFVDHVFCWFGVPQSLCSDQGPPFQSAQSNLLLYHRLFGCLVHPSIT